MEIREERPEDIPAIRQLVEEAFRPQPYSNKREHFLLDDLREDGALTVALVAEEASEVVGQVAFSLVRIDGREGRWHGLGPIAVRPDRQGRGIGAALVRAGLDRLKALDAAGCVLLGEPAFYGRFGFKADSRLRLEGVPPEYFLILPFAEDVPQGAVEYHPAFSKAG
ncbi:N-acetyltransferase [Inquilinus sp. CAU 1745]|uniref:GNAT family N-acetyltransferase n=1 Tax=Inquilinus sp. CAU 1745 TaxID=3140369 RepID=UPI00325A76B4